MPTIKKNISFSYMVWIILSFVLIGSSTYVMAEILHTPEGVIITHYPESFDLTGNIDKIDEKGVVIHDRYFAFAPDARFMTPQRLYASIDTFEVGQEVRLVLNEERQVSILCLKYQN